MKKNNIPIIKSITFKNNKYEPYADDDFIYIPIAMEYQLLYYAISKDLLK